MPVADDHVEVLSEPGVTLIESYNSVRTYVTLSHSRARGKPSVICVFYILSTQLTLYTLVSVFVFSILFFIHFLRCLQGESV